MNNAKPNTIVTGDSQEVMASWPDGCVDMCVTSPPFWGLRDYGVDGQYGLEETPEEYVGKMVAVFREVRRVLADYGTLWLNLGDSYAGSWGNYHPNSPPGKHGQRVKNTARWNRGGYQTQDMLPPTANAPGLKPKDLCGIPWRVALALQADGWYLRQDIIWHKPNPMPESCRDRCTKSHEYIFLLSKKPKYFYDQEAISEPCSESTHARVSQDLANQVGSHRAYGGMKGNGPMKAVIKGSSRKMAAAGSGIKNNESFEAACCLQVDTRNRRSVWTIPTQAYSEAHFATFPEKLVEPCIKAGCPKEVCVACGKPRERIIEKTQIKRERKTDTTRPCDDRSPSANNVAGVETKTTGWTDCGCGKGFRPGIVLDPFGGSCTTAVVAHEHGRDYVMIELSPEYVELARKRIGRQTEKYGLLDGQLKEL